MNNSINLIDYRNKIAPRPINRKQKLLRQIAISLLFLSASLSIIFFILTALSPLPDLEKQRKIASFNLSLSDKEIAKLSLINERTDKIRVILDKRVNYDEIIRKFQSTLPSDIKINSMGIQGKNISVVLSSNSLLSLNSFIEKISNDENSKEYSQIKLVGLKSDNSDNAFHITLDIVLL
jgi:Tfp pilus assembly protein PilN